MNDCIVKNNNFAYFQASSNGGVISLSSTNVALTIKFASFFQCKVFNSFLGGCVYFSSKSKAIFSNICANECSAYRGYFLYVAGTQEDTISSCMNRSIAAKCQGDSFSVCYFTYSNTLTRDHNATQCTAFIERTTLHFWYCPWTNGAFHNFYRNKMSILYGIDSYTTENTLSHCNIISNTKHDEYYGAIHTYKGDKCALTIDNIYAFNNTQCLISVSAGSIIISSMECDIYSSTGILVDTQNVVINKDYTIRVPILSTINCDPMQKLRKMCTCKKQKLFSVCIILLIFIVKE